MHGDGPVASERQRCAAHMGEYEERVDEDQVGQGCAHLRRGITARIRYEKMRFAKAFEQN